MASDLPPPPSPFVSFPQTHPVPFLGPVVAGVLIQAIETGIVVNQSFTFWSRGELEGMVIRTIIVFITLVALFQTVTAFYSFWLSHVTHYGDWSMVTSFMWADKMAPVVTASMAAPVQGYLIWRCWSVTRKSLLVLCSLSAILLASVISNVVVTVNTMSIHFSVLVENVGALPKIPPDIPFILALTSSAVLDVAVTTTLLVYLSKSKAHIYSSRFRLVMQRLTMLIWESAIPPCMCAVITVVTYLTMVNQNWWDLMFQNVLGKLYVISLFVTLNGKASINETNSAANDRLTSAAWVTSSPVRINVDVESHYQVSHNNTTPVSDLGMGLHEVKFLRPAGSNRPEELRAVK